jgi:hypothetical protein
MWGSESMTVLLHFLLHAAMLRFSFPIIFGLCLILTEISASLARVRVRVRVRVCVCVL